MVREAVRCLPKEKGGGAVNNKVKEAGKENDRCRGRPNVSRRKSKAKKLLSISFDIRRTPCCWLGALRCAWKRGALPRLLGSMLPPHPERRAQPLCLLSVRAQLPGPCACSRACFPPACGVQLMPPLPHVPQLERLVQLHHWMCVWAPAVREVSEVAEQGQRPVLPSESDAAAAVPVRATDRQPDASAYNGANTSARFAAQDAVLVHDRTRRAARPRVCYAAGRAAESSGRGARARAGRRDNQEPRATAGQGACDRQRTVRGVSRGKQGAVAGFSRLFCAAAAGARAVDTARQGHRCCHSRPDPGGNCPRPKRHAGQSRCATSSTACESAAAATVAACGRPGEAVAALLGHGGHRGVAVVRGRTARRLRTGERSSNGRRARRRAGVRARANRRVRGTAVVLDHTASATRDGRARSWVRVGGLPAAKQCACGQCWCGFHSADLRGSCLRCRSRPRRMKYSRPPLSSSCLPAHTSQSKSA